MKTSTPTGVLLKKHSLNKNLLEIVDDGEIEEEIKKRREEAINKSSDIQRKSISAPLIGGFTATELTQHCKDCIKLSAENKINTKNAFSFLLIDVMAAMAKKSDSEINKNFQVASCTLDASVKIYGYRVDAVHTEAIKMAGGVLSKEVANNGQNVESLEDQNEENQLNVKLKKKRRKKLTIVHPDTLNAKCDSDILMDVIPQQSFLMRKTDGNDLLIKIPKYNDSCVLYINSDYICWPSNNNAPDVPSFKTDEFFDGESLKAMLKGIKISSDEHLCHQYHNTVFGKESDITPDNVSDEEFPSQDKNAFEFDPNASVEDVSISEEAPEISTQRNRLQVPLGGYESDQEINLPPIPQVKEVRNLPLADLKTRITLNQLEYSMFDEQVLKAWAGPSYWKVSSTKAMVDDGKENEHSKAVVLKSMRKVKQKTAAGLFDTDENDLVRHLAHGDKTILNKSTMLNWNPQNVTVPKDCMYKVKNFLTLYHFSNFFIEKKEQTEVNEVDEVDLEERSDDRSENEEEIGYCSNLSIHSEFPEEEKKAEEDENGHVFDREKTWDEKNMVAVPNKVEKIAISTFIRKKSVDIKYLKRRLWSMLTGSCTSNNTDKIVIEEPITFSQIMKIYPSKLPNNLASSLSAPQIFNALLHLTNEKCLVLRQDKVDKSDFVVFQ